MPGEVWSKLRWSLAHRGVRGSLRAAASSLLRGSARSEPHAFDREHGTDTSGVITGGHLAVGHPHDVHITAYAGIPPSKFHETIRHWVQTPPVEAAEAYSFVDLGCGKGRALMLASALHFREVVGVELNPTLAGIAEANLARWSAGGKARRTVRIVCADATEFAFPPGPCLLYLANPFGATVMRRLLERIEAAETGDTVEVLYQTPHQAAVFAERSRWRLVWSEVIPVTAEDRNEENVYAATDRCNLYRLARS